LLGLPPLAGFAGKFQVFEAVYQAGRGAMRYGHSNLGTAYFILFGIAAVNTAISAYYYLRVVRAMLLDDPTTPSVVRPGFLAGLYLSVLSLTLFALGLAWDPAVKAADGAAMSLLAGTG
jgi:NADH-quinone oxidoreductase subunit N